MCVCVCVYTDKTQVLKTFTLEVHSRFQDWIYLQAAEQFLHSLSLCSKLYIYGSFSNPVWSLIKLSRWLNIQSHLRDNTLFLLPAYTPSTIERSTSYCFNYKLCLFWSDITLMTLFDWTGYMLILKYEIFPPLW